MSFKAGYGPPWLIPQLGWRRRQYAGYSISAGTVYLHSICGALSYTAFPGKSFNISEKKFPIVFLPKTQAGFSLSKIIPKASTRHKNCNFFLSRKKDCKYTDQHCKKLAE